MIIYKLTITKSSFDGKYTKIINKEMFFVTKELAKEYVDKKVVRGNNISISIRKVEVKTEM